MSTNRGTKGTKKPKVLPIGLGVSPDGLAFSQSIPPPSRDTSSIRSPRLSDGEDDDDDDDVSRGRPSNVRGSKVC